MNLILPPWAELRGEPCHPSRPQCEFRKAARTHDHVMLSGGLNSGKSWSGAWVFLLGILENRARMTVDGRRGRVDWLVGAPDYQRIDAGPWKHLLKILNEIERLNGVSLLARKPRMTHPRQLALITGDVIGFIATNPLTYAGSNVAGVWGDEIEEAEDPVASFNLMTDRLRDASSPKLWGIWTSTPATEGMGLRELFEERRAEGEGGYLVIDADTRSNPASRATKYYERKSSSMSKREVLAKLEGKPQPPEASVFGKEFDRVQSMAHGYQWPGRIPKGHEVHIGIDWGSHYAAVIFDHDPATGIDVAFSELMIDGAQTHQFLDALILHCRRLGIAQRDISTVWVDPQPADELDVCMSRKYFRGRTRYQHRWDKATKRESINVVRWRMDPHSGDRKLLFAPALRVDPSKRGALRSLQNYQWREKRQDGLIETMDKVRQVHWSSHAVDAIRQYCWRYRYERQRALGQAA